MGTYNTEHKEQPKENVKGIRIQSLSYVMIVASCIFYILILYITIQVARNYSSLTRNITTYTVCSQDADALEDASDYLTEQVRLYVMTKDPQYRDAYLEELYVTRRRENALENLQTHNISEDSLSYLQKALNDSNELAITELYAIRLVGEAAGFTSDTFPDSLKNVLLSDADTALSSDAKIEKAQMLVFNLDYLHAKEVIRSDISSCLSSIVSASLNAQETSADAMRRTLFRQRIYISVLFFLNIMTYIMIIVLIIKPLKIYIDCMKEQKMLSIMGSYEFKYFALTYNDIFNLKKVNETMLRQKAEHDALTGLANRGFFDNLQQILKGDLPLTLFLLDVDYFKNFNDTYGHKVGDQVLKKVASALQKSFRSQDFVMRIGGDEFAAVITHVTLEQRSVLDQKISFINQYLSDTTDGLPVVTLSIGAAFSDQGFTDNLYVLADKALYYVKENGRNGYALYQDICDNLPQ